MTINEITGQILLAVSGGHPTSDMAVREWDVRSYIPAAVNYALTQDYWTNQQREGDHEIPGNFISEYDDQDILTDDKGRDYVDFDVKFVNLGANRGIRFVSDNCGNMYKPIVQGAQSGFNCYWGKVFAGVPFYQLVGKKIYIMNRPKMAETVNIGVITDVSQLNGDDDLPIPAGYEPQVLDVLRAFFSDQRFTPRDYIIDGKDLFART